jgi:MscS family membrane protein
VALLVSFAFAQVGLATEPDWTSSLNPGFHRRFLGLAAWQWVGLVVLLGVAFLGTLAGRWLAIRMMKVRDRFTQAPMTPQTAQAVRRAVGILTGVALAYPFISELALPNRAEGNVRIAFHAVAILAAVLLVYALWDNVCDKIAERTSSNERAERLLVPVTRKLVRVVILTAGVLMALGVFGVNIAGLLAGLGIGGLVVALAAKDSVENVFGSLTILFDMPFALGDWVKIGTTEGVVEEINLRSTRLRTFEDTIITLPNANLIRASVENYGARRSRRQKFTVRVSYDSKPERIDAFCQGIREYLEAQPKVSRGRSIVEVDDLAEPSLGVLVQTYFEVDTQAEELAMKNALMLEILRQRDASGIKFAAAPRPPEPKEPA